MSQRWRKQRPLLARRALGKVEANLDEVNENLSR